MENCNYKAHFEPRFLRACQTKTLREFKRSELSLLNRIGRSTKKHQLDNHLHRSYSEDLTWQQLILQNTETSTK